MSNNKQTLTIRIKAEVPESGLDPVATSYAEQESFTVRRSVTLSVSMPEREMVWMSPAEARRMAEALLNGANLAENLGHGYEMPESTEGDQR
ncbi:Uncharacterised protein [Acidipropionibacterium jensenii]|uniref:Uncharacterized protein n=1 Tax=Acidipropionibacterium jensenii TaxID=1749 RepID=A0A448P0P8_9ACTN|nr:hypothetical protein [Acidipropionibacterium jensenii]VEI03736.1 Uncharacterised protein [Acidipropionibacterium jensenii]